MRNLYVKGEVIYQGVVMHHPYKDFLENEEMKSFLKKVERVLRENTSSRPSELSKIARHLIGSGGKRLRPQLVFLSYRAVDPEASHDSIVRIAAAMELIQDALAIERAGAFALLVEAVPPEVGRIITDMLSIPVMSIGAGMYTDGQLLIVGDMLGYFEAFTPKFVKKYANLAEIIDKAFREFCEDVRTGKFPEEKHCYRMLDGEYEKLQGLLEKAPPR